MFHWHNELMLCVASESLVPPLQRLPEPLIIKPIGRAEYFEVNLSLPVIIISCIIFRSNYISLQLRCLQDKA